MLNGYGYSRFATGAALPAILAAVAFVATFSVATARAETATFVEPDVMSDADRTALSAQGDSAGFLIGLNQSLGLLFDNPILTSVGDSLTVFTLPPASGNARARILIGAYNGGSPIFLRGRNVTAGNSRTITANNGLVNGCRLLGGCDYVEIITTRTRRGAAGVEVDYVVVDGEVVEVASPTPEPTTWALMIIAFAGVAWRLKAMRGNGARRIVRSVSSTTPRSLPSRGREAPQTAHP